MSKFNQEIVYEGWLTKSPPTKRIWRAKWRRRWFTLRQSGELPGQYYLEYYADRHCRKLKGTIDLDLCEQVDAGLYMERSSGVGQGSKLKGSVFSVRTRARTYHLEADCVADMEKWVDAICRVCGLRPTDDRTACSVSNATAIMETRVSGPYIPISECITGLRMPQEPEPPTAFTFDPSNIITSSRVIAENSGILTQNGCIEPTQDHRQTDLTPVPDSLTDSESIFTDDEWNVSSGNPQINLDKARLSDSSVEFNCPDWTGGNSFTKVTVTEQNADVPVPPRPPKPSHLVQEGTHKEAFVGPRVTEPVESTPFIGPKDSSSAALSDCTYEMPRSHRLPNQLSYTNASPALNNGQLVIKYSDDQSEDESLFLTSQGQYCNLPDLPPAVNRGLKPRRQTISSGHANSLTSSLSQNLHGSDACPSEVTSIRHLTTDPYQSIPMNSDCYQFGTSPINQQRYDSSHIYGNSQMGSSRNEYRHSGTLSKNIDRSWHDEEDSNKLQYLDLDLNSSSHQVMKAKESPKKIAVVSHNKSHSATESDSLYKTVDFLKTEAFNITRQDAEASRSKPIAN